MIIREYRQDDLEAIVRIEERAFEVGAYTIHMLRTILHDKDSYSLVAIEGDTIAGYIVILPLDHVSADVESIAVDPDFGGRGIGKALMNQGEEWIRKRGYAYSVLEVRDRNESAIGMYLKLGYRITEKLPDYYELEYRGSRDGYRMIKKLSSQ